MPNAIKWEGASTKTVVSDLGTTLAADTLSAAGSEYDNSSNLNKYGWLEIATSSGNLFSAAVARVGASMIIYMIQAPDGTNYHNEPVTADVAEFPHLRVAEIPIPTEAGVVPTMVGPIALPPHKIKFLVLNQTDQQMADTWQLNLYTNNLEVQ